MVLHPDIHFEIARQRHREFVTVAEHQRIANALRRAGAMPKAWRLRRRGGAPRPVLGPEGAVRSEPQVGLEA